MDCSQTNGGWFEFGALYSLGGEDGEVGRGATPVLYYLVLSCLV